MIVLHLKATSMKYPFLEMLHVEVESTKAQLKLRRLLIFLSCTLISYENVIRLMRILLILDIAP